MDLETVIYEVKDHISKIILNRPEKRNALNHQLLDDIDAAFSEADNDSEVRVVILAAAGPSFSAGYDAKESYYTSIPEGFDEWTTGNALRTLRKISERYLMIKNLTKPVIAQVHGYCVAGGCYLQMCCDIAIAAEDARLGHPAGVRGGVSSMPLWVTYLGERKAKELLMTSTLVDGKEAQRIGLVNRAVPPEKLEAEVMRIARSIADVPPDGMMILKEAINTHTEIMSRSALFTYHRQINALDRVGQKDMGLDLDALRQRTKKLP
ncbi:enoyl-CoA hydratase/isomerase family protein [Thermodesulfobacteriota bacterium]